MIALMCRTPIQVFRAIQIKYIMYSEVEADLYLFSTFNGYDKIGRNIEELNIFKNVYYIDEADYSFDRFSIAKACFLNSYFKSILNEKVYDELFSFNIYGTFNFLSYNTVIRNNPKLKFIMVEDGPNIYPLIEQKQFSINYLYPILGIKNPYKKIAKWYFSDPKKMNPFGKSPKYKLPIIDRNNYEFKNIINKVFNYKKDEVLNEAKIIFMEECFVNDGMLDKSKDLELFKKLQERYHDKECVVKLHPRSKENRFSKEFKVLESQGIPWEVYVLNIPMEDKIIVSLSCTTMISSKLLFGEEVRSLLLFPILENYIRSNKNGEIYLNSERKRYIFGQKEIYNNRSRFMITDNIEEAFEIIDNWISIY